MKAVSLRYRLIAILLGLILAVWVVSVGVSAVVAQQMIIRQVDRQLAQYMDMAQHTLLAVMEDPATQEYYQRRSVPISSDTNLVRIKGFGSEGREQATNLWFDVSHILVGEQTPKFPPPVADGIVTARLGAGSDAAQWRILYRRNAELDIWVGVGVDMEHAQNIGTTTFWRVILPLLFIMPITAGILFWGVGRGLRPLNQLAEKIALRKPQALDPIDFADVPLEMRPVVESLNGLLDRLERALTSEQRFTSNAAHELQTPLAAIKAEVQRHQRHSHGDDSRVMLDRISKRVSRAADTVKQLLTLARLDPDQEFQRQRVNLSELLIDEIAELGALATERGIELRLSDSQALFVDGNADWLKVMLRNLLVNAFYHSTSPGEVDIRLEQSRGTISLTVANDCAPLAPDEYARLTDRFYRPSGSRTHGVGLGLSIVERIAELHGADLALGSWQNGRGFRVEVRIPGEKPPAENVVSSFNIAN